jgi:hypothetical protein
MDKNKKTSITIMVILASLVGIWYVYLDFSTLFRSIDNSFPSSIIKRISVFVITIIVAISGKDSLSKKDSALLKIAFIAICCAEMAFLLHSTYGGIGFFLLSQILLIIRNGQGLKQKLFAIENKSTKLILFAWGIGIVLVYSLIISFVFYPILKSSPLLYMFIAYGTVLCVSFWVGEANYILELFPKKNSLMVSIAMACFFFSDILVGLVMVIKSGIIYQLANCTIWILYAPAIMLLAFSGYKYSDSQEKRLMP